ncbi:MAG: hypothetical protein IMZ61_02990 [Planctomycetes bacterium]|nr:hypothetical protein [Planctomycetota bacterium]
MAQSTIYEKAATATADTPFQVEDETANFVTSVNIHCYTNDCYYGNLSFQLGIIRANAVVWFEGLVRVSDLWFKNFTAGSNATVVIAGTLKKEQ